MSLFKRGPKRVRIVPNQDFLDGPTRYVKGNVYRVDIGMARYFERNGWIEGSLAEPPIAILELDVADGKLGHDGGI